MKNIITTIIAVAGLTLFAVPAMAATTATFSPSTVAVSAGKTFTVSISVNPNGKDNYAEKVEVKYPADMLEVRGFTFAPAWTALNQPGYDVTDNANGTLVKTAGYPSGFTGSTVFGTVTFYAKTSGTASISIGSNSLAFDAGSQSSITGTPATVTISTAAPVVVTPAVKPVLVASTSGTSTDATATSSDLSAAAGDATNGHTGLYITLGIIALVIIGGVVYFVTKKA